MAQRMLALDLDGTTLNHMGELSDGVRDAVAALPDEVIVVVATGRSIIATTPILTSLGIREGLAVCANGAVTIDLTPKAPRWLRHRRDGDLRPPAGPREVARRPAHRSDRR